MEKHNRALGEILKQPPTALPIDSLEELKAKLGQEELCVANSAPRTTSSKAKPVVALKATSMRVRVAESTWRGGPG